MMQFKSWQNTACSDASSCAPANCCAASACTATSVVCKDTAIAAVSFFLLILVSICLSILGLHSLLVRFVLALGLGILMILNACHSAKSSGEMERSELA